MLSNTIFAYYLFWDERLFGLPWHAEPWMRGLICGLMTTLGGIGHTLPYLINSFGLATGVAIAVVVLELMAISYIRYKYMDTPPLSATMQVMIGGILVFVTGLLIGSA